MSDILDPVDEYDDAYLLVRWLHELTSAEPNAAVVASLEDVCEDRGWHPYDAWQAITAGCGLTAAFDPDRHPRGHDGRFIELGALLKIVGGDREGQRGEVEAITPDPADPGNPTIRLKLRDGGTVDVKRDSVEQAAEKARLDIAPAPAAPEKKGGIFGRRKNREAEAQQQFRKDAGVEVNPETGLTERQEDTVNGEARDEWQKILLEEWIAEHPGEDPKTAPNLYAPAMEEVLKRRREGRPPGPANGEANKYDAELKERNRGTAASGALTAATKWAGDLHPRGRDGKFIEKLGMVELFDVKGLEPGTRGKVTSIAPSKQSPGRPDILIQLLDPKTGKLGRKAINVKPDNIAGAPEKGRLDPEGNVVPEAPAAPKNVGPEGAFDEPRRGRPPSEQPAPLTVEQQEQRLAAEEVRGATDEELERQRSLGPEVWQRAVAKEQANRQARRAQENAGRQKLIDSINADAANLSTTDPEERARGLDAILAKLRFSIIDTDKVHDHIYPPGESGRWSAERAAQHEQMWDDLLSQVEAASIPQERDALVLGGLPGAGKSYMLKPGQKADKFGVVSWEPNGDLPEGVTHVSINPDIVKEMLIQRGMLPEGISQDLKPMEQVTFLHEESSYVAKMFSQRLGDLGYNVVLDNTMDSEGGMLKRMTPLARQGYKFRGIFADIPQDESLASAKKRYIDAALSPQGGRFVPSSVQGNRGSTKGTMSKNRDAMDTLVEQDWFTEWMIVDNTGVSNRTPKGEVVGEGTGGGTAADRYLPGNDAARPKPGPKMPAAPEAAPTIDVNAPTPAAPAVAV